MALYRQSDAVAASFFCGVDPYAELKIDALE
jgi:hypothetical protein